MNSKKRKLRAAFSLLFILLYLVALAAEGYILYLCRRDRMTYMQGFLTSIPTSIVMYWLSCFFDDITAVKGKGGTDHVINRHLRRVISALLTLVSIITVAFWLYTYHTQITPLF